MIPLLGALAGDAAGSAYERDPAPPGDFDLFPSEARFTDDTVLTLAVADALLEAGDYEASLLRWGRAYPDAGYGSRFRAWLGDPQGTPRDSLGNGSAMRVSPVAWAFDDLTSVLAAAEASAWPSHRHPEAVRGAQAAAASVFLARTGVPRGEIRRALTDRFGYDLSRSLADLSRVPRFDATCPGSVPQALTAFLEAESFEDALRGAVGLRGDADTQAAIAGAAAQGIFDVPDPLARRARSLLPPELLALHDRFWGRFVEPRLGMRSLTPLSRLPDRL